MVDTSATTSVDAPIRILLIDDHAVMRAGLRLLLSSEPGFVVVGEAADRDETLELIGREHPDIILLDLLLEDDNSLNFLPEIVNSAANSRVLVLTGAGDPELHRRALLSGAAGLVRKEQAARILVRAIQAVHAGEIWFERAIMADALLSVSNSGEVVSTPAADKIARLTAREREVIALIGQRLKNQDIADRLFISESTVRHHLTSIFSKLGITGRLELMIFAYKHELASPPES